MKENRSGTHDHRRSILDQALKILLESSKDRSFLEVQQRRRVLEEAVASLEAVIELFGEEDLPDRRYDEKSSGKVDIHMSRPCGIRRLYKSAEEVLRCALEVHEDTRAAVTVFDENGRPVVMLGQTVDMKASNDNGQLW